MMKEVLLVGLGGAVGSILRFVVQRIINTTNFPYGTLAVNIAGCLLIGMLAGYAIKNIMTESHRLLLMTGFCGGFTTFSALTLESLTLLQNNRWTAFGLYIFFSLTLGLLATFAGYKLSS
jgi:CrcB protein